MPTKNTLVRVAISLVALLALAGCVSNLANIENMQTIHRKETSNDNLDLQHLKKCLEVAREEGIPVWSLEQCRPYLGSTREREPEEQYFRPQHRPYGYE